METLSGRPLRLPNQLALLGDDAAGALGGGAGVVITATGGDGAGAAATTAGGLDGGCAIGSGVATTGAGVGVAAFDRENQPEEEV